MDSLDDIAAMAVDGRAYDPNEVVLIGSFLDSKLDRDGDRNGKGTIRVESDLAESLTLACNAKEGAQDEPGIAVIYAFAFEGHTYRLPKPRVMVVGPDSEPYRAGKSSAVEETGTGGLRMWRMSRQDDTVSIEIEAGSLQSLVLDSAMPGGRSATYYASHMQLAHRGGRLTRGD